MTFCEGGFWINNRINWCYFEISAAVVLVLVSLVGTTLFLHKQRPEEEEPLLEVEHHQTSAVCRSLGIIILLTTLVDLFLDCYRFFHLEIPTVIGEQQQVKTASDALLSFAWIISTTLLLFVHSKEMRFQTGVPPQIYLFWKASLWIESLRLYEWIMYITFPIKSNPMQNKLDIAYFCLFLIRYALLVVLAITAKSYLSRLSTGPISSWQDMWQKTKKLFPFLWPKGIKLQLLVIACFGLLAAGRIVNVLVPYTYKLLVEDLTPGTQDKPKKPFFAWGAILLYTLLRFFQGGVGLLSSLQYFLWIPVSQYTTREICVQMLRHLHSLSLDFHIKRKTGEVLRVMDRGTASIGSLLSYIAFNILPVFVDIGLAVIYFVFAFDWLVAMIVFVTMILYIFFTVWITEWRTKFRREMNDLDSSARGRAVDSLLNFETVKYFGNEHWEVKEYEKAILDYQVADWKSSSSLNLLNTAQNTVITLGLMAGLLLTAQRVVSGDLTVGDFVAFITYLLQLYQPLNWFGTYYRVIQQNFIDMEKMLDLFEEHVAVQDAPDARPLVLKQGNIAFNDVSFKYTHEQDNDTLSNVSFTVPAGKTVAIVGASGGGKSTILRLLFRFYDINSGSIQIDGQDIRQVTQQSLRKAIGVVPQDTVLFNDTVRFNIRYGNVDATDEQVEQAAKAAQIHDRIMSFPDGYDTKVGERGLRLSGGEKQRIAIARTLLKNPSIILLDEATSALDNQTERQIQQQLSQVFKDRTTIVIAHRLSTIVDADEILVLRDGVVVQRGVHRELVTQTNGVYYKMWTRQLEQPK